MNILTFDIEDWYNHDDYSQDFEWDKFEVRLYEGVDKILSALDDKHIKASFMCLGWIAEKHPAIIRKISDMGHHIGCHSYQHQLATRFSRSEFREDTYKAKSLLEDVSGQAVDAFRVPSFSITSANKWAFDVLTELGFVFDCSVFPSTHEFGGIPNFKPSPTLIETPNGVLKELPINLGRAFGRDVVFTGGGYFRIFPYGKLKKLMSKTDYTMSYFHPSDFDPGQPNMPQLSLMRQLKNRIGLKGAYEKFCHYISDYDFIDIHTADSIIDWEKVSVVKLEDL